MNAPVSVHERTAPYLFLLLALFVGACSGRPAEDPAAHEEDSHTPGVVELGPEMRESRTAWPT